MARYFLKCSYIGTAYNGWQIQPHLGTFTIQDSIQKALTILSRESIELTGCGRTDTGVHALDYVAHFDTENELDLEMAIYKSNRILPEDISIQDIIRVHDDAHARFDAISRSYQYKLHLEKDPFAYLSYHYRFAESISIDKLNEAASLLHQYTEFFPFCKSNSDSKTTTCHISHAAWTQNGHHLTFDITADRFLRGMIRLIVGMCLNVSRGRLKLNEVQKALDQQIRLKEDWSVPAHGLVLKDIIYPYPLWANKM